MPDDEQGGRQWIVEPPGPGQVALRVAFGEGVQLTEEQADAVAELLRTLETQDPEVTGHALDTKGGCPKQSSCTLTCNPLKSCNTLKCPKLSASLTAGSWNLLGTYSPSAL
jgi:hypothetical protein